MNTCELPAPPRRSRSFPYQRLLVALITVISVGTWSLLGGTPAHAALRAFHTPSGNIGCEAFAKYLRCDIGQKAWRGKGLPRSSCRLDFGDSFTMTATSRPYWSCHGDTALHMGRALPYGSTWHAGAFTCNSRVNGLTCTNRAHHGFFLSRQSYRRF